MKPLDAFSEDHHDLHSSEEEPQPQPGDENPIHHQVLARDHKCAYRTGKCPMKKATKQNGERHRLCQFHRDKANGNQMRFDLKKKGKRKNRRKFNQQVIVSCPSRCSDNSIASVPLHMYYPAPPTSIMTKRSSTTTTTTTAVFREPILPTSHYYPAQYFYRPVPDLQMLPRDELQILVQLMWSEEEERPPIL